MVLRAIPCLIASSPLLACAGTTCCGGLQTYMGSSEQRIEEGAMAHFASSRMSDHGRSAARPIAAQVGLATSGSDCDPGYPPALDVLFDASTGMVRTAYQRQGLVPGTSWRCGASESHQADVRCRQPFAEYRQERLVEVRPARFRRTDRNAACRDAHQLGVGHGDDIGYHVLQFALPITAISPKHSPVASISRIKPRS
jgi:hypothetical protein